MPLLRALLYLRLTSLRNVLRSRLRRLRQPKYLVGAVAGACYFWFFFFRHTQRGASPGQALALLFGDPGRVEVIAALLLSLFALLIWILPGDQPGLAFSEAEVAFLFPAPLTRRQLIHYKLLDGLAMSLFGSLFFTLLSSGTRHGWDGALRHLGAWWSLNANLSLHQTAAALTIARLSALGLQRRGRRLLVAGLVVAGVGALVAVALHWGPGALEPLLWPARLAVRPFLAADAPGYLFALLPAAGLVAVHYVWVHRLDSPFEEASIARAQRTAEVVARARAGKGVRFGGKATARRAPFPLADRLPPEFALLWKNLMVAPPYLNRKVFLGAAAVAYAGVRWLQAHPEFEGPKLAMAAAVIALVLLGYVLVFGPQVARNDLRGDLLNSDLIKAWPLPGWRVVLGGLLAPTVLLTGIAWLLLLVAGLGLHPPPGRYPWLTPGLRVAIAGAAACVVPALCAVQLLVPNAATMLFPAWAQTGRSTVGGGGFDVMGQRLIFFAGQLLCLIFALLPAAVAAALTVFLTSWLIGAPAAALLAVLPVLLILAGEIWLGVHWVGLRFEALDISAELRG